MIKDVITKLLVSKRFIETLWSWKIQGEFCLKQKLPTFPGRRRDSDAVRNGRCGRLLIHCRNMPVKSSPLFQKTSDYPASPILSAFPRCPSRYPSFPPIAPQRPLKMQMTAGLLRPPAKERHSMLSIFFCSDHKTGMDCRRSSTPIPSGNAPVRTAWTISGASSVRRSTRAT